MTSSSHPISVASESAARPQRAPATAQDGFSLIEVLVTALIVVLLSVGVASALIAQTHSSGDQALRSQANTLVSQDQDRLRGLSDQALSALASSGSTTSTQTVGSQTYTVTSSAAYQDSSGNSSCASSAVDYYKITSTATWTEAFASASTQTASSDSLLARPVTGQLETVVTDQTGAPVQGAAVTATPSPGSTPSQSGLTDSTGCSVFAGLANGSYAVAAAKTGYVSPQNLSSATTTQSINNTGSSATAASAALTLGLGGTVTANFVAAAPSGGGQANGLGYTGGGPGYSSVSGAGTKTTLPAASQSAGPLFPFESTTGTPVYTGNYSVYGGQCAYQAPPAANLTTATVSPGGSATVTVKEPSLYIAKVQSALLGIPLTTVQPTDIVLTYSSGGCVDTYRATVAAPASGTLIGAVAPTTGWLASPGQPYAATSSVLSVCADYSSALGYFSGTVTTANASFTSVNPSATGLTITLTSVGACQ